MAKLNFTTAPTFAMKVAIPVPGKKAASVEFTFKFRDGDAMKAFLDGLANYDDDTAALMDAACGWDLSDPFERDSVERMVKNYVGSARAVLDKYIAESTGARLGN